MSNFPGGVPLMEFEGLTLNTDYEVLSGSMKAITDPVLRKKLTDQRNQKDASKENKQPVVEKKYDQPVASVSVKTDASGKPVLNDNGQPTAIVKLADGTTKEEVITQNTTFVGSDGNQVTVSSGGVMTPTDGKPVPPPVKSDTDPTKVGDGSLIVRFSKDEGQNYGFDGVENGSGVWGRDNFNLGTTQYYAPIKSIEAGKDDYVTFNQQGSGSITFNLEINGTATPLTPEGNRIKLNVPVTGNAALYAKDAQNRVVGKLTILSYPMVAKNVVLVSLNGSALPDASALQSELNKIFAQGVASVTVSTANFQTSTYDGAIDRATDRAERDHYKYSSEMRAIVSAFKETSNYSTNNNTVYLFFGNTSTSDLAGVMNRGYQFGFIFNKDDTKTIAHELGHGLFALEHTSNDNSNGLAVSDLMDYTPTGKALFKYQWQYVQNPPGVWGVFESGDDAESNALPCLGIFDDCDDIIANLRMMHNAAISNGAKGVSVKTPSINKTLSGANFEIDGIEISKMDLVFVGEPNVSYTLTMKEYEITTTGFIVKSGNKNIVTITLSNSDLEGSPSTKDKLKSYLFATKEDTTTTTTASFPITGEQLKSIFPGTTQERCDEVAAVINKYSDKFEINTPLRMSHFLGQIGVETGGLNHLKEIPCYRENAIRVNFGKSYYCDLFVGFDCLNYDDCATSTKRVGCSQGVPTTKEDIKQKYICSPELFDYVYSCSARLKGGDYDLGNGSPSSKDGSTFLGRGFIQLTGKSNYSRLSKAWNEDPENSKNIKYFHKQTHEGGHIEELDSNLDVAMKASMYYWQLTNCNTPATNDDTAGVTLKVKGSSDPSEVKNRKSIKDKSLNILK